MQDADVKARGARGHGRRERWRLHREQRRAELVASAVAAIRRHGAGVGMDEIAAEAGVSKPVLYRHFTDRADLWQAVGREVIDELLTTMSAQLASDLPPRAMIAAIVDSYLALIESDTALYRFIVRGAFANRGTAPDLVHDHMDLMAEQIARLLGDRLRAAGRDSGGAEPWAHGIVGTVHAAADWWMERRTLSRSAMVEYLCTLITGGLSGLFGGSLPGDEVHTDVAALRVVDGQASGHG